MKYEVNPKQMEFEEQWDSPNSINVNELSKMAELLECGMPLTDCCRYIGIQTSTFKNWYSHVRNNLNDLINTDQGETFLLLSRAMVQGKLELIRSIKKHSERDWKAAAYLLERMDANKSVLGRTIGAKSGDKGIETLELEEKKKLLCWLKEIETEVIEEETGLSVA